MDIKSIVKNYINQEFGIEGAAIDDNTALLSSGILDSISALQLVDYLEKEFSIQFKPHEVDRDNLDSVAIIANFVEQKRS